MMTQDLALRNRKWAKSGLGVKIRHKRISLVRAVGWSPPAKVGDTGSIPWCKRIPCVAGSS